ncbi:YbdD/YjiX family protein [Microbacterium gorillae]|uniref:YbdD/YjiX family protein n=1 Tax=Microbacterium gorillae TaxID=1231063 RepID=UPI00069407D4|nr:YbdD/YjiX family protein [Microbacterium gorillae]
MTVDSPLGTRAIASRAGTAARQVWWYLTNLMGDTAYRTYVEHQRRTHPDAAVMSERDFWRKHYADQDANPGSRCC